MGSTIKALEKAPELEVLIVYKKSQFELYQNSPDKEVRDYLQKDKVACEKLFASHVENYKALAATQTAFAAKKFDTKTLYRGDVNGEMLRAAKLIVSVGGDGTLLDIAHLCGSTRILGVNSDPKNSVGFFCAAAATTIDDYVDKYRNAPTNLPTTKLNTIQPYIEGVATAERAINDLLFAHNNPSAMTKYDITSPSVETRKDSGLLVCTAGGSTAWMYNIGGDIMSFADSRMQYRSRDLRGAQSKYTTQIEFVSRIREGMLSIDTQHIRYIVSLGQKVELVAGEPLTIIGDISSHQKK